MTCAAVWICGFLTGATLALWIVRDRIDPRGRPWR